MSQSQQQKQKRPYQQSRQNQNRQYQKSQNPSQSPWEYRAGDSSSNPQSQTSSRFQYDAKSPSTPQTPPSQSSTPQTPSSQTSSPQKPPRFQNESKPQYKDKTQQKRPRIELKNKIDRIILSEEHQAKLQAIEEQIKAIGTPTRPEQSDCEKRKQEIDEEIKNCESQKRAIGEQIDQIKKEKSNFSKENSPQIKEMNSLNKEKNRIQGSLSQFMKEKQELYKKKQNLIDQRKDLLAKLPQKNMEEGQKRLKQLEELISTSTLKNSELKARLAEKEKLELSLSNLDGLKKLNDEINDTKLALESISETVNELKNQKDEITKIIEDKKQQTGSTEEKQNQYQTQIKDLEDQLEAFNNEIASLQENRKNQDAEFKKKVQEFYELNQKLKDLKYSKFEVYQEAERYMSQKEVVQKQVNFLVRQENPTQKKITTAKSLIEYLKTIQKENKPVEDVKGKKATTARAKEAAELIAQIRKPKAKDVKTRHQTSLTHSLYVLGQFSEVGLNAPLDENQIANILEQLQSLVKEIESSLILADVKVIVQNDGKVIVKITI